MQPAPALTPGAIQRISNSTEKQVDFMPRLQVISVKLMHPSANQNDRYRLVLSDGEYYHQSMLATAQNELVTSGQLVENCVVCLEDFVLNEIGAQGSKIIIILRVAVLSGAVSKVGDPQSIEKAPAGGGGMAAGGAAMAGGYGSGQGAYGGLGGGGVKSENSAYGSSGGNNQYGGNSGGGGGGYGGGSQGNNPYGPYGGGGSASKQGGYGSGGGYGHTGGNSGPIQRHESGPRIMPIADLNPYQNRWTIKARVTGKGEVRRWSNQRGEGYLCSIDLLDEQGGEVRGTFFKEAVDKFCDMLQVNSVYTFSGGKIKVANKQYSNIKHEYEITFNSDSEIHPVDDDKKIKAMNLNFTKIAGLKDVEIGSQTDVIAVVKDYSDMTTIMTKNNKEVEKRNITLVDDSDAEVTMTLWGSHAKMDDDVLRKQPVIAFKGVKVSDYNGCSLSTFNSSNVAVAPDMPETRELESWWTRVGSSSSGSFKAMTSSGGGSGGGPRGDPYDLSLRATVASIKDSGLGTNPDKPDYAAVKAYIAFIKHDQETGPWYTACTGEGCNKKVIEEMDSGWRCEKCNKTYPDCKRRFILSLTMNDHTGQDWFSAFDAVAQPMLSGHTADELNIWKQNGQEEEFEAVFVEACWQQYVIKVRVKAETVNDEQRIKSTIIDAQPVDPIKECAGLIKAIKMYG